MKKIIVITGPTATGKTKSSVLLAHKIGGEIINADSMQVYRGMDIGTAKPTLEERESIPHHMFDVADPREPYSVSRYVSDASEAIDGVLARGNVPIVVGGTLLYIDSLISGRTFADTDPELRARINALPDPYSELSRVDPDGAAKLHPNDKIRVTRALEVFCLTGRTISQHNEYTQTLEPRYYASKIALNFLDRQLLYYRINERVDKMIEQGLIEEVKNLNLQTLAIGYKEISAALQGECSLDEAVEKIKKSSRNYAKRQLIWLRQSKNLHWILWNNEIDFKCFLQNSTKFLLSEGYNITIN